MQIWAPELASVRAWAEFLGANEDDLYNWKKNHKRAQTAPRTGLRPKGKVPQLVRMFEPLRGRGCDPWVLARHVYTGDGEMPEPSGAVVPTVRATTPALAPTLPIDPEKVIEKACEAAERGEDPLPMLRFAREALRAARRTLDQARSFGLAAIVGGTLTSLSILPGEANFRANAKIDREQLAQWAARLLGPLPGPPLGGGSETA